jgi:hypothetical protein
MLAWMKNKLLWVFIYIFAGIIGKVWVYVAQPFRAYARSVVYNYHLQNKIPLKRLDERKPKWVPEHSWWVLQDIHGVTSQNGKEITGFVRFKEVNTIQYNVAFWLFWGWLDDDSVNDTTDLKHVLSVKNHEQFAWEAWLLKPFLDRYDPPVKSVLWGNTFDLGNVRGMYPYSHWVATFIWNSRNTAMNFKYKLLNY